MPTDRRTSAATATVGTGGVVGGALLRATGTERARALTGTRHHLAINDVRRARKLPHGKKAIIMYAGGNLLGAVSAPAALVGGSQLVHPTRLQPVAKDFIGSGIAGAVDALHQKSQTAVQRKPTKARATGFATGTATAGLGTLAAHRVLDAQDARRIKRGIKRVPFRSRTALAAVGGLLGAGAGIPIGAAVTRRVAPGYTVTATGVQREVKKFADTGLMPRCGTCGTRIIGPCPVCHEIPVPITKAATIHLATGRGRHAACNAANATRTSRSTNAVTCAACKRTHGFRSRTSITKRSPLQNAARWGAGITGVGTVGVAEEKSRGKSNRQVTAETAGGLAGQGAYQAAAYGLGAAQRKNIPAYMRRDVKQSQLPSEHKPLKRQYEKERRAWLESSKDPLTGKPNRAKQYRSYPKHWPNARTNRIQGWTHGGNTGRALGAAVTTAGALGAGHAVQSRRSVSKADPGAQLSNHQKRARVYAAGAVPGVGPLAAARTASRLAPPDQRKSAGATQYGAWAAGNYGGGAAGALGLSYAASKSPKVMAASHKTQAKITDVQQKLTAPLRRHLPAPREGGKLTAHKAAVVGRVTAHLPKTVKAAPVAAGLGWYAGKTAGGLAGGQVGYSHVLNHESKSQFRQPVAKANQVLARGEEERQIKRQRHNAALGTLNAGIGAAGVGVYGASLHPKVSPKVKGKLATAAIGTTIAAGGLGSIAGFRGAQAQRHDAEVREAKLNQPHRSLLHPFGKALTPIKVPRAGYVATRRTSTGPKSYSVRGSLR